MKSPLIPGAALALALSCASPCLLAHEHAAAPAAASGEMTAGQPVPAKAGTRVVAIEMDDTMRYRPSQLRVKRGEAVRIVATNRGQVMHEIVLGSRAELEAHGKHMREHPEMHHD